MGGEKGKIKTLCRIKTKVNNEKKLFYRLEVALLEARLIFLTVNNSRYPPPAKNKNKNKNKKDRPTTTTTTKSRIFEMAIGIRLLK